MTKKRQYQKSEETPATGWTIKETPAQNLRDREWPRFLEGPDPRVLAELYVPALESAIRYDRCCAYFSSSVLAAAARGFAGLIQNLLRREDAVPKPAVRLLVNEELSARDAQVLQSQNDLSVVEKTLLKRFKTPKEALEKDRLAMLAWMLSKGFLEIKVGVMRYTGGISHAKYGYVVDSSGDILLYRGSGNETAAAISQNYEQFEISVSWEDEEAIKHYQDEFEKIWKDKHPSVRVVDLPTALRERLLKLVPDEPPVTEPIREDLDLARLAMKWMFIAHAPYLQDGNGIAADALAPVDLWPHQRNVVDETVSAWPEGRLLCDEVGMGKTIEAIMIIRRLMAGRGASRVLILVPAGLLEQWQEELREKGGLLVPYLRGEELVQPDRSRTRVEVQDALHQPILLMSREAARKGRNKAYLLDGPAWDLVLMDEAHAARRTERDSGGFNTGNLLLSLLRDLQLSQKARSILLLSATPMQIDPWEPWDLMCVLGMGGYWASGFDHVDDYYNAIGRLKTRGLEHDQAHRIARLLLKTDGILPHPLDRVPDHPSVDDIAKPLRISVSNVREANRHWLEANSPLKRFLHRNTRETLRRYFQLGLADKPLPQRHIDDLEYDYTRGSGERTIYEQIKRYIDERYEALEEEKAGKGFVMTVYRRRMASSSYALSNSLRNRVKRLNRVINKESLALELEEDERPDERDWGDIGYEEDPGPGLPETAEEARQEKQQIEPLIRQLENLGGTDSKRNFFLVQLQKVTADGRSVLVFTSYLDTMDYLRDQLRPIYHDSIACYSGRGGEIWDGERWQHVEKSVITKMLNDKKIRVLVCNDAASEGLNLQAAGALINYDMPWNPSRVEQRIGRIDRIGQAHAVLSIVNIYLKDSVDTRVYRVLRERCGLFEHFVGPMQPILEYARKLLERERAEEVQVEVARLQSLSDQLKDNHLIQGIYSESGTAAEAERHEPLLSRSQVESCIRSLCNSSDPSLAAIRGKSDVVRLKLPGLNATIGLSSEALDLHPEALPLHEVVKRLAEQLQSRQTSIPLVIGTATKGPFCADMCLWIRRNKGTRHITTFDELSKALKAWDGHKPSPETYHKVMTKAQRLARRELKVKVSNARETTRALETGQLEAGKSRLKRELGLNLFARHRPAPLPTAFADSIREAEHRRFREAFNILEDVNCWDELDLVLIKELADTLTKNQRKALDTYRNIDVALDDPRIIPPSRLTEP